MKWSLELLFPSLASLAMFALLLLSVNYCLRAKMSCIENFEDVRLCVIRAARRFRSVNPS